MAKDWIKLYTYEFLFGSTRYELTREETGDWARLMALAGLYAKEGKRQGEFKMDRRSLGEILGIADMAELERVLTKLASPEIGKIELSDNGTISLVNFVKYNPSRYEIWAAAHPEEAAKDRHQQSQTPTNAHKHSPTPTSLEGEGDRDRELSPPIAEVFHLYEENIGMITPHIGEEIKDAMREYASGWVADAIKIAVERNKRKWSYIKGILQSWTIEGRDAKSFSPAPKPKQRRDRVPAKYTTPDELDK